MKIIETIFGKDCDPEGIGVLGLGRRTHALQLPVIRLMIFLRAAHNVWLSGLPILIQGSFPTLTRSRCCVKTVERNSDD